MNDSREQAYRNCPWSRVRGSPKHILVRLNADGLRWSDKPSDFTTHWSQHPSKNHKSTDLVQPRPHKDVIEWYTHIVCMDSLPRRTHRKAMQGPCWLPSGALNEDRIGQRDCASMDTICWIWIVFTGALKPWFTCSVCFPGVVLGNWGLMMMCSRKFTSTIFWRSCRKPSSFADCY